MYVDDFSAAGHYEKIVQLISYIREKGPEIGLFINLDKTKILMGKRSSYTLAKNDKAHYSQLGLPDNNIIVHYDIYYTRKGDWSTTKKFATTK